MRHYRNVNDYRARLSCGKRADLCIRTWQATKSVSDITAARSMHVQGDIPFAHLAAGVKPKHILFQALLVSFERNRAPTNR